MAIGSNHSSRILLFLIEHYPEHAYRISYSFAIGYFSAGSWVFHSLYQHTNIGLIPSVCATLLFIATLSISFLLLPVIINRLPGHTWQRADLFTFRVLGYLQNG